VTFSYQRWSVIMAAMN